MEIGDFFNKKLQKTRAKIRGEHNAKIVNYKIRAFIENVRDKLQRFEPASFVDHKQSTLGAESQLDRIEQTVTQVLKAVKGESATPLAEPQARDMQSAIEQAEYQSQTSMSNIDAASTNEA